MSVVTNKFLPPENLIFFEVIASGNAVTTIFGMSYIDTVVPAWCVIQKSHAKLNYFFEWPINMSV